MPHPCRSGEDTGGNPLPSASGAAAAPRFKKHACVSKQATHTLCGLGDVRDVDVVAGYKSQCTTCYPRERELAWTPAQGNPGDLIGPPPAAN